MQHHVKRSAIVSAFAASFLLTAVPDARAADSQVTYLIGWQALSLGNVQAPLTQAGYASLPSSSLVQGLAYESAIAHEVVLGVSAGVFGYGWFGTSLGRTGMVDGPVDGGTALEATYRGFFGNLEIGAVLVGEDGLLIDNYCTNIPDVWPVVTLGLSEFDLKVSQVVDFPTAVTQGASSLTLSATAFQIGLAVPTTFHFGRRSGIALGIRPAVFFTTPTDWSYPGASGVVSGSTGSTGAISGGYLAVSIGRW